MHGYALDSRFYLVLIPGGAANVMAMPRCPPSILWLRRDLRFEDHPALVKAANQGPVLALFVLDPALIRPAGPPGIAFLLRTLGSLDRRLRSLGASLTVMSGDPE